MTIQQFINRHKISARVEWADENPNMADMPVGSSHWKVTLTRGRKRLTVPFSMGPALSKEPNAADVLSCLASDAVTYENNFSFEDWASEFGFDLDSRKAFRTFKAVQRQTVKLKAFLEPEQFEQLLYQTESL